MIKNFQKLITNYAYNNNFYCRFNFDGYIDEIDTIKGKVFYGSGFTLVLEYQLNYGKLFCRFILQQNPPIEYNPSMYYTILMINSIACPLIILKMKRIWKYV